MALFDNVTQAFERRITNIGRTRARNYLLAQSDRVLADIGFSRERLERGNAAWPWTASEEASVDEKAHLVSPERASSVPSDVISFPASADRTAERSGDDQRRKAA